MQEDINKPADLVDELEQSASDRILALQKALEAANNKAQSNWDLLLRKEAECQNIQRRSTEEVQKAHKFALERFANEIVNVVDTMEHGLAAVPLQEDTASMIEALLSGMKLTHKMLLDTLAKFGITQVNPMGEVFDPAFHEALSMQESTESAPDTILTVLSRGYLINGRLLRPARVVVSRAAAQ
jgi:molecular chaperone GrpE